ncbi:hypothetical protein BOTBODRAFT_182471 [Botryobasidium botryosum FD-172 SS1]|uniref:BTB domain-containing protein n=1 Tax=Botryobasidium botryosum (strain FD-172 SS1) TaxID=930990 RepID=A0A067LQP0_BOTB1|nr:hypothetical protein BOTBODRAFT_182471 [Botryobasidium botryosum FD-172 SS1]
MATKLEPAANIVAKPAVTRHPLYYFNDGSITFRVENTLFRVQRSKLILLSEFFKDLLTAEKMGDDGEGQSDDCPIEIPDTSAVDFANLVWWLYTPASTGPSSEVTTEIAYSILVLSHKFQFPLGLQYAIGVLQTHELALRPAERLHVARRQIVPHWLRPAVLELVQGQMANLTSADAQLLGVETVRLISLAHADIEQVRKGVTSFSPLQGHSLYCHNEDECGEGFVVGWARVGVLVHRPGVPVPLAEILTQIEHRGVAGLDQMHSLCYQSVLDTARPRFQKEADREAAWVDRIASMSEA